VDRSVQDVAKFLKAAEMHHERAFASIGRLMSAVSEARAAHNIAPVIGYQVQQAMSDAARRISDGQESMHRVHRLLRHFATAYNIDVTMFGDEDTTQPVLPTGA
jgi:hypothetical protein